MIELLLQRVVYAGYLSLTQHGIENCRTAALGSHVEACEGCGHWRLAYNSGRNRLCSNCQSAAARTWLAEREADLLPVDYFHVVFTLPAEIASIAFQNKAVAMTCCSGHPTMCRPRSSRPCTVRPLN